VVTVECLAPDETLHKGVGPVRAAIAVNPLGGKLILLRCGVDICGSRKFVSKPRVSGSV
jgi:hypothetical protein